MSADEILIGEITQDRVYCSFLIQKDTNAYDHVLSSLPFEEFPATQWVYEPALWFFFGRNQLDDANQNLDGRPEHTDDVSHLGTWHYQLSGVKQWFLRPTPHLASRLKQHFPKILLDSSLRVECNEGDIILVNTRLWFHRTVIPPQSRPSVSYARDFRAKDLPDGGEIEGGMKNVDGLYATNDIASGTIIFTEADMPDCELHRSSTNPNCEVVELEGGTNAVVSSKAISAGEFFCIQESSDDESDGGFDDENDENLL
jgi:hypothetical protein